MALNLESLKNAVAALERSVDVTAGKMQEFDEDLQETLRAGLIQHFEIAYELEALAKPHASRVESACGAGFGSGRPGRTRSGTYQSPRDGERPASASTLRAAGILGA